MIKVFVPADYFVAPKVENATGGEVKTKVSVPATFDDDDASTTCPDDEINGLDLDSDVPDWDLDDGWDTSERFEPARDIDDVHDDDELRPLGELGRTGRRFDFNMASH